jgi:hypothetical protein
LLAVGNDGDDERIKAGGSRHVWVSCQAVIALQRCQRQRGQLKACQRVAHFVIVVLHELPIEFAFLNPRKIIFHRVPIYTGQSQDVLLVHLCVLTFPTDFGDFLGVQVHVDEAIPVHMNMDRKETFDG